MLNRINQFLVAHKLLDQTDGRVTVWISDNARAAFLKSLPIEMHALAASGSKGFAHKGVVFVFDDDAQDADVVIKLNGKVCGTLK